MNKDTLKDHLLNMVNAYVSSGVLSRDEGHQMFTELAKVFAPPKSYF